MDEIRSFFLRAGGFRTHVVEAGNPSSPALMLIHDGAFGTDAMLCWEDVIRELGQDFHIYAPDLLSWGKSQKIHFFDRSFYDFRLEHLGALCAVLDMTEPLYLAGSSFGAELVVRAAAQTCWQIPVKAAVAITGTGGADFRNDDVLEQLIDYTPSLEEAARVTAMLVVSTDGLEDHIRRRYENSLVSGHFEALDAVRLVNPTTGVLTLPPDEWPAPLEGCMVPIHFVEGSQDLLLEPGWAEKMAARIPNGSSQVLESSHEPNIDQPEIVAEIFREVFLDS
ncbi:MAG: alpha/beta hydrolase [Acidimicrobiia bacterium]